MTVHGLMWVPSLCIYVKMYALMCMRPELAEKYGFTKLIDNLCFDRNSNLGFYCSRTSDHKIIFVKICVRSSDSSGIARV